MFADAKYCIRCQKHFYDPENIGTWRCRVHMKDLSLDYTDENAISYQCCNFCQTHWERLRVAEDPFTGPIPERVSQGCLPCDHLSEEDADNGEYLPPYAVVPDYLTWHIPPQSIALHIPDMPTFQNQKEELAKVSGESAEDMLNMIRTNAFNSPDFYKIKDLRDSFMTHYGTFGVALKTKFNALTGDVSSVSSYWPSMALSADDINYSSMAKGVQSLEQMLNFLGTTNGAGFLRLNDFGETIQKVVEDHDPQMFIPFRVVRRFDMKQDFEILWRARVTEDRYRHVHFYK